MLTDAAPASEVIRAELAKVLASQTFRLAASQREFLRYAVEEVVGGRGDLIKEYMIATAALGRDESFDPRLDPIVRTQARKLRARLTKYYEDEGKQDVLRIEFPKGSYAPCFGIVETPPAAPPVLPVRNDAPAEAPLVPTAVAIGRPLFGLRRKVIAIALSVLALAGSGSAFYVLRSSSWRTMQPASDLSIAVMPFANIGNNKENEFLSDGLTDELIGLLAQSPGVQVVGRTSAFRFKGKSLNLQEIGQKLNVRTVLEGSVWKFGNTLRVTVQLNNAADGYHLWTGSYDRKADDIRSVQIEIARSVLNILGAGVSRGDQARRSFPRLASPSPGAYQNYLRGLYFWNKLNVESLATAIRYFEQAIADDPSFARAYTALADSYVMAPQVATAPPPEIVAKIRAAASKALRLDGGLGEAHIDLAICAEYEFDWATAEKEFRKGLDLSGGNAVAHLWYSKYLALTGRKHEVLKHRRIAAELDPVSPYAVQSVAGYLSVAGRYDEAIEGFRSALALQPDFGLAHQGLGIAYLLKGAPVEAIAELKLAHQTMVGPRRLALLGYAYGMSGQTAEAHRILDGLLEQSRRKPVPALAIAQIYIGLGDKDRAFEWLERTVEQRDLDLTLQYDSLYEPLRSDPRYMGLLRKMRFI